MTKTIRSVERALAVLGVLQTQSPASLEDLHRATALPRATLLRLLKTLQEGGMVRRGLADSLYRNSTNIPRLVGEWGAADRLAEVAGPILDDLCRNVGWPSDLAVRNGLVLELTETSRTQSPMPVSRNKLGDQINFPMSAVGRAYLAVCSATERRKILGGLRRRDDPALRIAHRDARFDDIIAATRERGYAVRDPFFHGRSERDDPFYDDGLDAIAVAIADGARVSGVINLLWRREFATADEMADRYLDDLRNATRRISTALA